MRYWNLSISFLPGAGRRAALIASCGLLLMVPHVGPDRNESGSPGTSSRRPYATAGVFDLAGSVAGVLNLPAVARPPSTVVTPADPSNALATDWRRLFFPAQKRVVEWMGDTKLHRVGRNLITPDQLQAMAPSLEPGDVFLIRQNWYLSNVGLPGFWSHAELYIGTPDQLEAWARQPKVQRFMAAWTDDTASLTDYLEAAYPERWAIYQAGRDDGACCIIQALSEGIVLSTLEEAAGDYLAVLRPRVSVAAKARAIVEAFGHLDKAYDFDFDFARDETLVCTELIWRCYQPGPGRDGLRLTLVDIAGRRMLPANEIARLYNVERHQADRQLDFVYFLDASENEQRAFVADEAAFAISHTRTKWGLVQK